MAMAAIGGGASPEASTEASSPPVTKETEEAQRDVDPASGDKELD